MRAVYPIAPGLGLLEPRPKDCPALSLGGALIGGDGTAEHGARGGLEVTAIPPGGAYTRRDYLTGATQ